MKAEASRGFTLIEALVSVALIAMGLAATVSTLGAIARADSRAMEGEKMQRLAMRKYDEIIALNSLTSGEDQGDYTDIGEPKYIWRAERSSTGVTNLDSLLVEVGKAGENFHNAVQIEGLVCNKPSSGGSQ